MTEDDRVDLTPWTAPPPPTDLADRVGEALAAPIASTAQDPPSPRARWWWLAAAAGGALAVAAGIALVASSGTAEPRGHGAVVATSATTTMLADGIEAMAEAGAEFAWHADARGVHVAQRSGIVTYRQRGALALDVSISSGPVPGPAAAVLTSTRATYRVEVPMNRPLIVGGGAAAVAVAVIAIVTVYDGGASAKQPDRAARPIAAGERVELTAPAPTRPAPQPVTVAARDRVRRDAIAAAMLARRPTPAGTAAGTSPTGAMVGSAPPAPLTLGKDEIRAGVKDVVPMLAECYEAELERDPTLGETTVKTQFTIDSDPDLGTIVTLSDLQVSGPLAQVADFRDCMTATIEAVVLPPLGDGGQVTVNYPFEFRPNDVDDATQHPSDAAKSPATPTPVKPLKPVVTPDAVVLANDAASAAMNVQYARALALSEQGLKTYPTDSVRAKLTNIAALSSCQLKNRPKALSYYRLASPNAKLGIRQTCMRVAQFDPEAS